MNAYTAATQAQPDWWPVLHQQIASLKFGVVQVVVHDAKVVQIERTEKLRFPEFATVQAAISSLEKVEEQAGSLADDTARLAADQESLRRSIETEQQTLAKGAETLELVKKRFAAELKVINELMETATKQTDALAKKLGA